MFYLTTHSTHFIYGYMASDIWLRTILIVSERERNVLFNDTLNTFYLRLYGEREKCFILRRTQHILSTVIWRERDKCFI